MSGLGGLWNSLLSLDLTAWLGIGAIIVAIIGIILATLVPYHVARAQGLFRKSRLFAQFGAHDKPKPSVLLFNLRQQTGNQVASIPFYVQNLNHFPVTGITAQFNFYPRKEIAKLVRHFGPMYERSFPGETAHVFSIADRDCIELKIQSLAPDEGHLIVLPYLIASATNDNGGVNGVVTLDLHHSQGRRIRSAIYVCVVSDVQVTNDEDRVKKLNPILGPLVDSEGPLKISVLDAVHQTIFRVPAARVHWLIMDVDTTMAGGGFSVQTQLQDMKEPKMYRGVFDMHLPWAIKAKALLVIFAPLLLLLCILIFTWLVVNIRQH